MAAITDKYGVSYTVVKRVRQAFTVYEAVDANGRMAGWLKIDGASHTVGNVDISDGFRRRGLASSLYDFVERDLGVVLAPSADQTAAAKEFWDHRQSTNAAIATSFNARILSAERVAARQAASMVTGISKETRAALRVMITEGLREGIPIYDLAKQIVGSIGLNSQQASANLAYRQSLVDMGLRPERVDVLVERYTKKQIAFRAESIARYEIMDALNRGAREGWLQAQKDGFLGPRAEKEWVAAHDACKICLKLHGVRVPLASEFPDGAGQGPPRHVRCRCTTVLNP